MKKARMNTGILLLSSILLIFLSRREGYAAPERVGEFPGWYRTLGIENNVMFAAKVSVWGGIQSDSLDILDLSSPAFPAKIGALGGSVYRDLTFSTLYSEKGLLFAAEGIRGLSIIDVTIPANPIELAIFKTSSFASVAAGSGKQAFVVHRSGSAGQLSVVDFSNLSSVTIAGFVRNADLNSPTGMKLFGGNILVSDLGGGLFVINASDPRSPRIISQFPAMGCSGLDVGDDKVVLADRSGLGVLDLSNPVLPRELGRFRTSKPVKKVALTGNGQFAVIAVEDLSPGTPLHTLIVVNISDPSNTVLAGSINLQSMPNDLAVKGDMAYVAENSGIEIFRLNLDQKLPQAISFAELSDFPLRQSPIILSATSSSGQPITYQVVSGPAQVSENQLILTGIGRVTIRAMQVGSEMYGPATPVDRFFNVLSDSAGAREVHLKVSLYSGLLIEGEVGRTYEIQYTTDASPSTTWHSLGLVTLTNATQLWLDVQSVSGSPRRFYQVVNSQ